MGKKLVVFVHGIGTYTEGFHKDLQAALAEDHDASKYDVTGLAWDDVLTKVEDKYPIIEQNFASALADFNFPSLQNLISGDNYKLVMAYVMDVLVYIGLPDMTTYIQNECLQRLQKLTDGREEDAIIIAHSLGAAMIPNILWRLRCATAAIPYFGLFCLASPLGYKSPINWALSDFLEIMGRISSTSRDDTLYQFALEWTFKGDNRLHFICNSNDIVCSDVQFNIMGKAIDIIPVQQGFDANDIQKLTAGHNGSYYKFTNGTPDVNKIVQNHDFKMYLAADHFKDAFDAMLAQ